MHVSAVSHVSRGFAAMQECGFKQQAGGYAMIGAQPGVGGYALFSGPICGLRVLLTQSGPDGNGEAILAG
jgi:hypothetical protein